MQFQFAAASINYTLLLKQRIQCIQPSQKMLHLMDNIDEFFEEKQDPWVREYPLVSSFSNIFGLFLIYIIFVKFAGPKLMKNLEPFQLRNTLIIYNFVQILISLYIFCEGGFATYLGGYSVTCEPADRSYNEKTLRIARVSWICYASKWLDCLDTVFFVLRKKYNQITTLHLFHHSVMPLMVWIGLTFFYTGNICFPLWINSFIHVIMYSYYLVSALGPEMQKKIAPWKKSMTIMQLVQFGLIIIHAIQAILRGCDYPATALYMELFYGILFFIMFSNFYRHTYCISRKNIAKSS